MHLLFALTLLAQQPDTVRLPEIITTASRLPGGVVTAFTSHTVLTGVELHERGLSQLGDALRDVAGIVVVQAGSRGAQASLFLRGGESDYVKLLVDGVVVNSPGGWFNVANLSTSNIERVEIVRGPGSVLHGENAMAGVIQVFTRQGRGAVLPELWIEAGGEQTRRVVASVSGGGSAGTLALETESFRTDGSYPFNSGYRHEELSGRLTSAPGSAWRAATTFRVGESRAEFPTDGSGVLSDSNQYTTERRALAGMEVTRTLSSGTAVQVAGSFSQTREGFRDTMDSPADTSGYGFVARNDGRINRSSIDLRLLGVTRGPLTASAGVQYEDERQRQRGAATSNFGFGVGTEANAFRAQRSVRAGYGEASVRLSSAISLAAGGRVDNNSAFGTLSSWRIGFAAQAVAGLQLHGQVGRAFKAPTFSELFANSPFEVGNPDLTPELAASWEVGLRRHMLRDRLALSASWFDQDFRNLIQYASAEPDQPTYANVGHASSRGLEVEARAAITPDVTVTTSVTRLWTEVLSSGGSASASLAEGLPLIRRPGFSGAASVRWAFRPEAAIRLDLHRLGSRDDVDFREFPAQRVAVRGRTLVDLSLNSGVPLMGRRITLSARVENLLDTHWEQTLGYPGRARLLHLGLRAGR